MRTGTTGPLILASTSPRRADLLVALGRPFTVLDPGIDDGAEAALASDARARGHGAAETLRRLAVAKLLASVGRSPRGADVVAADTAVVDGERLLGKARDRGHAREVLWSLRGRSHRVLSGVAVRRGDGRLLTGVAESEVRFRPFTAEVLDAFLDHEVWPGKAGAYGVQDPETAPLVEGVSGSESNVRGLPLEVVRALLEEAP